LVYIFSPRSAYNFMQVEEHAYHTYDAFLKEHGEELLALPAPEIAIITTARATFTYLMNFKLRGFPKNVVPDRKSLRCVRRHQR